MKKIFFAFLFTLYCNSSIAQWIWQYNGFPTFVPCDYIYVVNPDVAWVTAYQSNRYTHTTNGSLWVADTINIPSPNSQITNIYPANGDTAWACMYTPGAGGAIVKTTDGGSNWTQQSSGIIFQNSQSYPDAVYFWNDTDGVCIGDPVLNVLEIYTTTDGGITWNPVSSSNIPVSLSGEYGTGNMYSVINNTIWFVTNKGRVYKSTDRGYTWNVYDTGNNTAFSRRIKFINSNYGIITNTLSPLVTSAYYTTDGGATWNTLSYTGKFFGVDFDAVPGTASTFVSAGNITGGIGTSFSDDGGFTWFPLDTNYSFFAIDFIDNHTGYAADGHGTPYGISKYTGLPLQTKKIKKEDEIQIYPIPSKNKITVLIKANNCSYELYDLSGKLVMDGSSYESMFELDIEKLNNGIYFLSIYSNANKIHKKILKN